MDSGVLWMLHFRLCRSYGWHLLDCFWHAIWLWFLASFWCLKTRRVLLPLSNFLSFLLSPSWALKVRLNPLTPPLAYPRAVLNTSMKWSRHWSTTIKSKPRIGFMWCIYLTVSYIGRQHWSPFTMQRAGSLSGSIHLPTWRPCSSPGWKKRLRLNKRTSLNPRKCTYMRINCRCSYWHSI